MSLLNKLQSLKDKFIYWKSDSQDVDIIDGWIKEAKRLLIIKSLKDNDGVAYILDIFNNEINKIDEKLKSNYSKDMPDYERDRLLDRKDLAQKYLNLFKDIDGRLEKIEEEVDKNSVNEL
jgi:myosin heavy subunit